MEVKEATIKASEAVLTNIAILAGNSRVCINNEGCLVIEPQLAAFKAGLICAIEYYNSTGTLPHISVAFDHTGIFRTQFLMAGVTNSQKRKPRLSQLRPEIVAAFEPIAIKVGIPLDRIKVIHEDSARSHANYLIDRGDLPRSIVKWMKADHEEDDEQPTATTACAMRGKGHHITCAAITSEYFSSSTPEDTTALKVFIEHCAWSQPNVYVRGAMLTQAMGKTCPIQINLVDAAGKVLNGRTQ